MVIVFYNNDDYVYICSEDKPMQKIHKNNPEIKNMITDNEICYVQDAHFINKKQFVDWIINEAHETHVETNKPNRFTGFMEDPPFNQTPNQVYQPVNSKEEYIHCTSNGTILIEDIKTNEFPEGIILRGKWNFIPVKSIGYDVLENSVFFRILKNKGKIEIVDQKYVDENKHKNILKKSPAQDALDSILVPAGIKAHTAAEMTESKKVFNNSGPIEIEIEG